MAVKLGDLLLKAKLITPEQLQEGAQGSPAASGMKLGESLVKLGFVTEDDITETLSAQFGVPSINLSHFEIDPNVLKLVARRRRAQVQHPPGQQDRRDDHDRDGGPDERLRAWTTSSS